MSEVLAAERDALDLLANCRRQADGMLEDARHEARAMARQTQQRVARLHANCADRTSELIRNMERDEDSIMACEVPEAGERQILLEIASDVARDLTTIMTADAD